MALAHITQDDGPAGQRWFRAEIGSNSYWRAAVGGERSREDQGARLIADPAWIGPLEGPVAPETMGRIRFAVDEAKFDGENRFVQLMSFRGANGEGPAVSAIVETRPTLPGPADLPPPAGAIPLGLSYRGVGQAYPRLARPMTAAGHTRTGIHPMRWEFADRSQALAFPALLAGLAPLIGAAAPAIGSALPGLVSAIAPMAGPLISALLGGGGGGGAASPAPGAATPAAAPLLDEQAIAKLVEQIQQLVARAEGGPRAHSLGHARGRRAALAARARQRRVSALALVNGGRQRSVAPVRAQVVPVALLTQLMPLLSQVLTPQTVQSLINAPNQHMQTVFNGLRDAAKLGIESHEQDLAHLRAINPGVDDASFDALLAGLGRGLSAPDPGLSWKRAESTTIKLTDVTTVAVAGRQCTLLAADSALSFPLSVELPGNASGRTPSISEAVVQLQIKDQETLEVLHQQMWEAGAITASGPLAVVPSIAPGDLAGVPTGRDLLFCFALIWTNRRGERRGAPVQHLARLADRLMFDRIEETGERITLDDEPRFGDYMHVVWSNRLRSDARRVFGELVYVAALNQSNGGNRRLETALHSTGADRNPTRREVRLRSGFEYSLDSLIALGAILDPASPPVDAAMHAGLSDTRFVEHFNRSVRIAFDFRGVPDESFRMIAVPTMAMMQVHFATAAEIDQFGQVRVLGQASAVMPVPAALGLIVEPMAAGPDAEPMFHGAGDFMPARLVETAGIRRRYAA